MPDPDQTEPEPQPDLFARVEGELAYTRRAGPSADTVLHEDDAAALLALAKATVAQVQPGSVVVLRGDVPLGPDQPTSEALAQALADVSGHRQFVVVHLADPEVSLDVVHDPEALVDLLGLARQPCACHDPAHPAYLDRRAD